jgi:hypothetical protein
MSEDEPTSGKTEHSGCLSLRPRRLPQADRQSAIILQFCVRYKVLIINQLPNGILQQVAAVFPKFSPSAVRKPVVGGYIGVLKRRALSDLRAICGKIAAAKEKSRSQPPAFFKVSDDG